MKTIKPVLLTICLAALTGTCAHAANWQDNLQARDLDGDRVADAYYDKALHITWIADWTQAPSMTWEAAQSWASTLNHHGVTGWRLPGVVPSDGTEFDVRFRNNGSSDFGYARTGIGWGTASELGHMFYVTLGNIGWAVPDDDRDARNFGPQAGWSTVQNRGPFAMFSSVYWTGSAYPTSGSPPGPLSPYWVFDTSRGNQQWSQAPNEWDVTAVRDGDVGVPIGVVPEPASWATALAGLVALGTRRWWGKRSLLPTS